MTIVEVLVDNGINSAAVWCVICGCLALACLVIIDAHESWKNKRYICATMFGAVIVVCLLSAGMAWRDSSFDETKYVVTVDDSVDLNEFCNKYEIIAKSGNRYVVKELNAN